MISNYYILGFVAVMLLGAVFVLSSSLKAIVDFKRKKEAASE